MFVIEAKARSVTASGQWSGPRVGITVTKKLGTAVVRNRVRRRIREILRARADRLLQCGVDYVVVARPAIVDKPFAAIAGEFERALERLRASASGGGREPGGRSPTDRPSRDTAPRTPRV